VNDLLVVLPDSIDKRLLDDSARMAGCTAPYSPSLGDRGSCTTYINIDSGHSALERLLEMVTSACDSGTAPTSASTPQTGGFERLRLRPQSEPTCSLGTRRDTSRRCGRLGAWVRTPCTDPRAL
jgi:hypothetical protein